MSIRRQLVNFGSTCTDFRIGCGALEELPRLISHVVGTPKRALLVADALLSDEVRETVRRALVDTGFSVEELTFPAGGRIATFPSASRLFAELDRCALTADDLVVACGADELCSLVAFCSKSWCGGTSSVAIPLTLDAMCTVPTAMRALDVEGGAAEMVSLQPSWDMVVCDLDFVIGRPVEEVGRGYACLLASALSQSKRVWDQFGEKVAGMADGGEIAFIDALCSAQTARSSAVRSANPSARNSLQYGMTTARALRACLGDSIPAYQLLAEGMRFEARLAHDACGLNADVVFELDDRFDDLGVEEQPFALDADRFVAALKADRFRRSNRFLLALPKAPGSIRLAAVEDEVLERHARAYLASRAELLEEE